MVARVTAVIAVARRNVMVIGIKPDRTVANTRIDREFLRQLPAALQIRIDVPHQVAFVATFIAFDAVVRHAVAHHEVLVSATVFAHVFVVQTGGEGHRNQQLAAVCPASVHALIVALHINHPAGVSGF